MEFLIIFWKPYNTVGQKKIISRKIKLDYEIKAKNVRHMYRGFQS